MSRRSTNKDFLLPRVSKTQMYGRRSSMEKVIARSPAIKAPEQPKRRQHFVDEKEWNERMKFWEEKRKILLRTAGREDNFLDDKAAVSRTMRRRVFPAGRSYEQSLESINSDFEPNEKLNPKEESFALTQSDAVRTENLDKNLEVNFGSPSQKHQIIAPSTMVDPLKIIKYRLPTTGLGFVKTVLSPIQSESDNNNNLSSNSEASSCSKSKNFDGDCGARGKPNFVNGSPIIPRMRTSEPVISSSSELPSGRLLNKQSTVSNHVSVSTQSGAREVDDDSVIFFENDQPMPSSSDELKIPDKERLGLDIIHKDDVTKEGNEKFKFSNDCCKRSGRKQSSQYQELNKTTLANREVDFIQKFEDDVERNEALVSVTENGERMKMEDHQAETRGQIKDSYENIKTIAEPKRKKIKGPRKSENLYGILNELLLVTEALNEEKLCKYRKTKKSKSGISYGNSNDRDLSAIVSSPETASIDDIQHLPVQPIFVQSLVSRRNSPCPVLVECVTTAPEGFTCRANEASDVCFKRPSTDRHGVAQFEWFEDFDEPPISSEELQMEIGTVREVIVDRRGCNRVSDVRCTSGFQNGKEYSVRRYEICHDASNCCIRKKHSSEPCTY